MRLQQSVVESDLDNVRALVGDFGISTQNIGVLAGKNIATMQPTTRAEFDEYIKLVAKKFSEFEVRLFLTSHPLHIHTL
jgi:hypothetical protein